MIELFQQYVSSEKSVENKISRLREALQLLCLKIIQDKGYFNNLAFVGGTALRVLYDLRRFSEDLDFSVVAKKGYNYPKMLSGIEREIRLSGLNVESRVKAAQTVQMSWLKFPGLLKSMRLSDMDDQKLSIKLEVDSNPPKGWQDENTVVNKMYLLNIKHYSLSSLFATKLHACFFRKYVKGRDFYDLLWYLSKKTRPNYVLLNNAVKQTEEAGLDVNEHNIKELILKRLEKIDFNGVRKDVGRFLEDSSELALLDKSVIAKGVEGMA